MTCETCHTTTEWTGAKFDHNLSRFALTGAHVNTACGSCHINGQFTGTPTECVDCHRQNFNNATNPNHAAGGFPTTCQSCHTTSQWQEDRGEVRPQHVNTVRPYRRAREYCLRAVSR